MIVITYNNKPAVWLLIKTFIVFQIALLFVSFIEVTRISHCVRA